MAATPEQLAHYLPMSAQAVREAEVKRFAALIAAEPLDPTFRAAAADFTPAEIRELMWEKLQLEADERAHQRAMERMTGVEE